jgi:hypothetical protein|tara:strand:+ start:1726 stop:2439 length:714 start_codon:yes stop_codon:yes gene_type:complete
MPDDFMEDLWASVFESSDYEGSSQYADQAEYDAAMGGFTAWQNDETILDYWGGLQDIVSDFGGELGNIEDYDFQDSDSFIDWLDDFGYDFDAQYFTDEMVNLTRDWEESYLEGMDQSQKYFDWKDDYTKYVTPYSDKKEGYVSEDTKNKIDLYAKEYGVTKQNVAVQEGRSGISSGKINELNKTIQDSLGSKTDSAKLEERLDILNMRSNYKKQFYGNIMDIAQFTPGILDPDQVDE